MVDPIVAVLVVLIVCWAFAGTIVFSPAWLLVILVALCLIGWRRPLRRRP